MISRSMKSVCWSASEPRTLSPTEQLSAGFWPTTSPGVGWWCPIGARGMDSEGSAIRHPRRRVGSLATPTEMDEMQRNVAVKVVRHMNCPSFAQTRDERPEHNRDGYPCTRAPQEFEVAR